MLLIAMLVGFFSWLFYPMIYDHFNWTHGAIIETQNRGDKIAFALDKYYQHHDTYPSSLNELVPEYLLKLDNPTVGNYKWEYTEHINIESNSYTLMVYGRDRDLSPVLYRDKNEWYMDTR
jgi:hypothetical protein